MERRGVRGEGKSSRLAFAAVLLQDGEAAAGRLEKRRDRCLQRVDALAFALPAALELCHKLGHRGLLLPKLLELLVAFCEKRRVHQQQQSLIIALHLIFQ